MFFAIYSTRQNAKSQDGSPGSMRPTSNVSDRGEFQQLGVEPICCHEISRLSGTYGKFVRKKLTMATKDQRDKVWEAAKPIRGKDPDTYRQDPYGNQMFKPSYGRASAQGWEIDHIKPAAKGGSDATRNLQALNTSVNRSKQDSSVKRSRHNQ